MSTPEENVRLRKQIQSLERELRTAHSKQEILLGVIADIAPNLSEADEDIVATGMMKLRLASLGDKELAQEVYSMMC